MGGRVISYVNRVHTFWKASIALVLFLSVMLPVMVTNLKPSSGSLFSSHVRVVEYCEKTRALAVESLALMALLMGVGGEKEE